MFRAAAAWQRTPVEEMTSEQFASVVHWAVIAIAIAVACSTALAAIISSLPERGDKPSKLARALRSLILAHRRRHPIIVRRDVPGPIQYRDRPRFVYVATDDQGRVRNPDDVKP